MNKTTSLSEKQLFFQRWLKSPLTLGALFPSSENLSRFMAVNVAKEVALDLEDNKYIVEIGAGTGAFTHALLEAGVSARQLISIELDPSLFSYLQKRFPNITTLCGDAQHLSKLLPDHTQGRLACIVSGIPMVTLPKEVQKNVVEASFKLLPPKGLFFQFTYSPFSSIPTHLFKLEKKRIGTVFSNFPPATVWAYSKAV
ncbi:MAG: rRNA adenine N-6-methyltransferase family protein [Holosporaceae bacterium]